MTWLNSFCRRILASVMLMGVMTAVTTAKSLYVITEIVPATGRTPIRTYDIGPDGRLTYQDEFAMPFVGGGGLGLAIDSDSQSLFITYEYTNEIHVVDATTMQQQRIALAMGADDLAGIVFDHDKKLLYCIDRGEPTLYVYKWDPVKGQLNIAEGSPVELEDAAGFGIALDEIDDRLYVGGARKEVLVYDTATWSLVRRIPLSRAAISVAVDPARGYLYTGGGYVENHFLTQYNLATETENEIEIASDAGVIGVGVDPATGYIYLTTGRDNRNGDDGDDRNDLRVYDTHLELIQSFEKFARDPTGLVIPGKNTSYNPLRLVKTVEELNPGRVEVGALPEVPIDGDFSYTICFDHDAYSLTDVTILDTLPPEITFVRADGDGIFGQYDRLTHTYLWRDPPLSGGSTTCLNLVAHVQPQVSAGAEITNSVTIDTGQTPPTTVAVTAVAAVVVPPYKPISVTKNVTVGSGGGADPTGVVYAKPGDNLTYRICYDNRVNTQPVSNVTIVDTLPAEVAFVRADGDGVTGQYTAFTHTYTWTLPSLAAGATGCFELVVQLNRDVAGGTVVTNQVTTDSDETAASSATVGVVVEYEALQLTKTIRSGAVADPLVPGRLLAKAGDNLTYEICLANPSATRTVTHVSIVDTLPPQTTFVSAEGDGASGYYDAVTHTYTWFYGSLAPASQDCLDLVVRILPETPADTVITNTAMLTGTQTPTATTVVDVVVAEEPPPSDTVDARLFITPAELCRDLPAQPTSLMVVMYLPEGLGKELIANVPVTLDPGGLKPFSQTIFGSSSMGKVMAFFDANTLLAVTQGYGDLLITVTGQLVDGRSFQDKEEIQIVRSGQ
jgi:uncharacterized repeat protein (TIGR01451 family)